MKFDRRYWILIGIAVASAIISSFSTLWMASVNPRFQECNSVAAACFLHSGMIPCMAAGILAVFTLMVAIPFLLRQNEHPGFLSVFLLSCITIYTVSDATNNISAIMGWHQTYLTAHALLDTTNNMTGTVIGTGDSLC